MTITLAASEPDRLDWHVLAARRAATATPAPARSTPRDVDFLTLQAAYRRDGGLARGEEVAARLGAAGQGGYLDLARRLVAGQLFSFHWAEGYWLPMFQFDHTTMTMREGPRRVLDVLRGTYDGWDMAHWHVRPNDALAGCRPLALIHTEPDAVLAAARLDRHG